MARTVGEVSLATELWTPEVRQRFEQLFAVASRKSLSQWRQVSRNTAEVLVLDGAVSQQGKDGSQPPCVVYVGGEAATQPLGRSSQGWAAHLEVDFTLSDLIDMLDRAAVFLMDWKARQKANTALTVQHGTPGVYMQNWSRFTKECIAYLATRRQPHFILWGSATHATFRDATGLSVAAVDALQAYRPDIPWPTFTYSAHPAARSVTPNPLKGSRPFSKANEVFRWRRRGDVDWSLR